MIEGIQDIPALREFIKWLFAATLGAISGCMVG